MTEGAAGRKPRAPDGANLGVTRDRWDPASDATWAGIMRDSLAALHNLARQSPGARTVEEPQARSLPEAARNLLRRYTEIVTGQNRRGR